MIDLQQRRKFFDDYPESYAGPLPALANYKLRLTCPCCGYPTLGGRGTYEICFLCNWEDEGQDDNKVDESSAANHGMSLAEARANFSTHRVMYEPGWDPRVGGGDTPDEQSVKQRVVAAFEEMRASPYETHDAFWRVVHDGQRELYRLLKLSIREYERQNESR